eukprot:541540-Rhodomonas_salina.1
MVMTASCLCRYVLFVHELVEPADQDVVERFNALPRPGKGGPLPDEPCIISLAWVPASAVREKHPKIFQTFACGTIKVLLNAEVSVFQSIAARSTSLSLVFPVDHRPNSPGAASGPVAAQNNGSIPDTAAAPLASGSEA